MNISIIGLGLIGGSIAAACKQAGIKVTAFDNQPQTIEYALQQKLIANHGETIAAAIKDAEIIVIAVPPEHFESVLQEVSLAMTPEQVITDTLSVKSNMAETVAEILGNSRSQFVASHPITGSEKSGVQHANKDLFIDHCVVLSPLANSRTESLQKIDSLWQRLGANTVQLDLQKHDEIMATASHLPHVISYAFSNAFLNSNNNKTAQCTGGSFADMTRIATSNPALWADICSQNREQLLEAMNKFEEEFDMIRQALTHQNKDVLFDIFEHAATIRKWRKS